MIAPNEKQGSAWLLEQVTACFGEDLSGRILAAWGIFGETAAPDLVDTLLARGARIKAYATPTEAERERYGDRVIFCDAGYRCLIGADALLVHGDGRPYRRPDFHRIMVLLQAPVIFDDRALYPPERMRELGFEYYSMGRKPVIPPGRAACTTPVMTGAPRASGSDGPIVATKNGPVSAGPAPG
jgi:UDPglucose 6-dehydrogenase